MQLINKNWNKITKCIIECVINSLKYEFIFTKKQCRCLREKNISPLHFGPTLIQDKFVLWCGCADSEKTFKAFQIKANILV